MLFIFPELCLFFSALLFLSHTYLLTPNNYLLHTNIFSLFFFFSLSSLTLYFSLRPPRQGNRNKNIHEKQTKLCDVVCVVCAYLSVRTS